MVLAITRNRSMRFWLAFKTAHCGGGIRRRNQSAAHIDRPHRSRRDSDRDLMRRRHADRHAANTRVQFGGTMKPRILLGAVTLTASLALGLGSAMAQSTTATPTATPTPSAAACSVSTLPNNNPAICATGAAQPPSVLGISGGNYNSIASDKSGNITCSSGTLGALVQDANGVQYVLSTNHTFARNSGGKGSAKMNEAIVQPGLTDLGCWQDPTDQVAALSKWTPLNFGKGVNEMDAAIAKVVNAQASPSGPLVPGIDPLGRILNIVPSGAPPSQWAGQISATPFNFNNIVDGMGVIKMGRTTCLTTGRIDAWDAMGVVSYPNTSNPVSSGIAFFDHQILVFGEALSGPAATCSFADKGDSGALVLTADTPLTFSCPQAVGMVFASAGPPASPDQANEIVAVTPIQTILNKFKVTLVGKQCTASNGGVAQIGGSPDGSGISAAMRASIDTARVVKQEHARNLLRNPDVVAVGIGSADTPDTAALKVYLRNDSPAIRRRVMRELKNNRIPVRFRHAPRFKAL